MGDYRNVSETQDKSTPETQTAPSDTPAGTEGSADTPVVKPVIRAAAAKRANASVIGMLIALVVSVAAFLPIVLMNPSPKTDGYRPNVNVSAIARNATGVAGFTPVAPGRRRHIQVRITPGGSPEPAAASPRGRSVS